MRPHFDETDDQLMNLESPKKMALISDSGLRVIGGLLAVIGGALSFLGQHPKGYWVFLILAGVVLAWSLIPRVVSFAKRMWRKRDAKRYVAKEYPRLKEFYDRLSPFLSENDGRSFRNMLRSASTSQNEVVTTILAADYIPGWLYCYGQHLKNTPNSILEFLQVCNEFTAIVSQFNRNYVIRTQEGLERTPLPQAHFIDQFEEFREEFAHYLRELENWTNSVRVEAGKRVPNLFQYPQTIPTSIFERAKSFRGKVAVRQLN